MFRLLPAGIEARTLGVGSHRSNTAMLLATHGVLPGAVGVMIARTFGQEWTSLLR